MCLDKHFVLHNIMEHFQKLFLELFLKISINIILVKLEKVNDRNGIFAILRVGDHIISIMMKERHYKIFTVSSFSAPLYTFSVLLWGARLWLSPFNIWFSLPIKKRYSLYQLLL